MSRYPAMTRADRASRAWQIEREYERGASSRKLAKMFGMSDGRVRQIIKQAGIARPVGRPANQFPTEDGRSA